MAIRRIAIEVTDDPLPVKLYTLYSLEEYMHVFYALYLQGCDKVESIWRWSSRWLKAQCFPLRVRRTAVHLTKGATTFWVAVAGFFAAIVLGISLGGADSDGIRYAGLFLELLGLSLVAHGLSQARKLFGRPSVGQRFSAWWQRLIHLMRKPTPQTVVAGAGHVTATGASATATTTLPPSASLEERLTHLESRIKNAEAGLAAHREEQSKQLAKLSSDISQERRDRTRVAQEIDTRLESFAVGGIGLELVGAVWLFIGVLAASAPDEIATFVFQ